MMLVSVDLQSSKPCQLLLPCSFQSSGDDRTMCRHHNYMKEMQIYDCVHWTMG